MVKMALGLTLIYCVLSATLFRTIATHSIIHLQKPKDFAYHGMGCYNNNGLRINCTFHIAPTASDLPTSYPLSLRRLNDTNLLYIEYDRDITVNFLRIWTTFNYTSKVKFEAEYFYEHAGFADIHVWYGVLEGDSYMWFPYQYQLTWINASSGDIPANEMDRSKRVGFTLNSDQYAVFRKFRIILDAPDPPPLLCDRNYTISTPDDFSKHGFKCGVGTIDARCEILGAGSGLDLPDTFERTFKTLLENEAGLIYFNAPDLNPTSQELTLRMEIADLLVANMVQFSAEVYADPDDPNDWKRHVMLGPGSIQSQWFFLENEEDVGGGWKRYWGEKRATELVTNFRIGFKVRFDHRAVFRKFEIRMKPLNEGEC